MGGHRTKLLSFIDRVIFILYRSVSQPLASRDPFSLESVFILLTLFSGSESRSTVVEIEKKYYDLAIT